MSGSIYQASDINIYSYTCAAILKIQPSEFSKEVVCVFLRVAISYPKDAHPTLSLLHFAGRFTIRKLTSGLCGQLLSIEETIKWDFSYVKQLIDVVNKTFAA